MKMSIKLQTKYAMSLSKQIKAQDPSHHLKTSLQHASQSLRGVEKEDWER